MKNQDKNTVEGFGDEWSRFDQSDLPEDEQQFLFDEYFSVFPWKDISKAVSYTHLRAHET